MVLRQQYFHRQRWQYLLCYAAVNIFLIIAQNEGKSLKSNTLIKLMSQKLDRMKRN